MGKYFSGYSGGNSSTKSYTNNWYGNDYGWGDGSSYGNSGYRTSYGNGSSWNWGNFGGTTFTEDNDNDLYIKNHDSYFTPKDSDIRTKIATDNNTAANRKVIKEYARFFFIK